MAGIKNTIWLIWLVAPVSLWAQDQAVPARQEGLRVQRLSVEDGLPHASVKCILQDRQGFMWFGSHGLCKYDGRRLKVYKPRIPDPGAMLFDVRVIYEDNDGIFWIGTEEAGLARFDPLTETFTAYQYDQYDPTTLSDRGISAIAEDREGILWIGTVWNGINRFDPKTQVITRLPFNKEEANSLRGRWVRSICDDGAGKLWIATEKGLNLLDPSTSQFAPVGSLQGDASIPLSGGYTSAISKDRDESILFGTNRNHLVALDPTAKSIAEKPLYRPGETERGDAISAILKDTAGQTWLGTTDGLWRLGQDFQIRDRFRHEQSAPKSLSSNVVQCLYQDRSGMIWVGTNRGVDRFDPSPPPLVKLKEDDNQVRPGGNEYITSICTDRWGDLWIGYGRSGLSRLDPNTGRWQTYRHDETDPNSLANNSISVVHASRKHPDVIWIGHSQRGISRLSRSTGQVTHLRSGPGGREEPGLRRVARGV